MIIEQKHEYNAAPAPVDMSCRRTSVTVLHQDIGDTLDRLGGDTSAAGMPTPSSNALTVDVAKLRVVLNALLDHVESGRGPLIEVDRDHYWLLALRSAFCEDLREPGSEPDDLGVGQISDDIETVHSLAAEVKLGDAFLNPWHDLQHAVVFSAVWLGWISRPGNGMRVRLPPCHGFSGA